MDPRGFFRTFRELDAFDGDDGRWLRGRRPAPQGRFNAGQKVNAALTGAFTVLFFVSGLLLWLGERDTRFRFASTVVLHDGLMFAALALLVGHLYLALIHPGDPARAPRYDARRRAGGLGARTPREVEATIGGMTTVLVVDDEPIVRDVVGALSPPRRLHRARGGGRRGRTRR